MNTPTTDREAATQIIDGVLAAGWDLLFVRDGEEDVHVNTRDEALDAIFAVDMAHLFVQHEETDNTGWIWFVLGNDPDEVVADHTTNLSPAIDPVTDRWWSIEPTTAPQTVAQPATGPTTHAHTREPLSGFRWPCERRTAHGPHDGCPGVAAHPLTMIGGQHRDDRV